MDTESLDTPLLFTGLLALVVLQRLLELSVARRNREWLLTRGGHEIGAGHYPAMVALHTLFLLSCLTEVWLAERPFLPPLAVAMVAVLLLATGLRYWAIRTLGHRWTTRVIVLPGAPRIASGPYRFLRHPNYLAVVLEIAALPLVHTAWLTASVFTVANAAVLTVRIRVEERGLRGLRRG
jgi:methyltransferase